MRLLRNLALFALLLVISAALVYGMDDSYGNDDDDPFKTHPRGHWGAQMPLSALIYMVVKPHGQFIPYYENQLIVSGIIIALGFIVVWLRKRKR